MKCTASIVLYNTKFSEIETLVETISQSQIDLLFLIDNSKINNLENYFVGYHKIKYHYISKNIGFGCGHNLALKMSMTLKYKFHFVINPDITIDTDTINNMITFIDSDDKIGGVMPSIYNLDGSLQYLPKLIPNPLHLLYRKLNLHFNIYHKFINKYELRSHLYFGSYNVPILSGCFLLLNLKAINEVGFFDKRFFMYFEDWDLSRRINEKYKTLYVTNFRVYHGYKSGANKNLKLFFIFMKSFFSYFYKWGFIFDSKRNFYNKITLNQFEK